MQAMPAVETAVLEYKFRGGEEEEEERVGSLKFYFFDAEKKVNCARYVLEGGIGILPNTATERLGRLRIPRGL
ncbi:hypothetical protein CEXT_214011 [Caerostris extrusa]|uniref:Uncharacterized protein n=1 Tax=Caerostris extrusa TaxID=172846 RepID=A0AAV4P3F0_CAEEX|nr:hypothetical protein CEXT_214011 [Caerostris extrusa]